MFKSLYNSITARLGLCFMSTEYCNSLNNRLALAEELLDAASKLNSFSIKVNGDDIIYVPAINLPTFTDYSFTKLEDCISD